MRLAAPPPLARLSELIAHRAAQGPLSLALTGGPGAGKTHALADVVEGASLLSTAALANPSGPFLPRLVALRLDAADIAEAPEAAIAERLHARLSREYPHVAQRAAEEAAHAAADPRQTARALADHVDEARRRLAAERAARDEAATRRARLTETVLFETPGSQIDAYARGARGKIEPALRAFGFASADPTADYKGLVQTMAETGGAGDRFLASLRALWAYQGQKKLIVWGVVFFVFAWLLNIMAIDRSWLGPLQSGGDSLKGVAAWIVAHIGLLASASRIAQADRLCLFRHAGLARLAFRAAAVARRAAARHRYCSPKNRSRSSDRPSRATRRRAVARSRCAGRARERGGEARRRRRRGRGGAGIHARNARPHGRGARLFRRAGFRFVGEGDAKSGRFALALRHRHRLARSPAGGARRSRCCRMSPRRSRARPSRW